MSIEENRKRYEGTGLQALVKGQDRTICERCYCCSSVNESAPCWQCGGFADEDDDEWGDFCSVCEGEGEIYFLSCLGSCDENGDHRKKEPA